MFTDSSSLIGDDLNYSFVLLAGRLKKMGHQVSTIDSDDLKKFDAVVFIDFPGIHNKYFKKLIESGFKNIYLVILESPLIKPDNLDLENHKYFKKIFTWDDNVVNNTKYFKIQYSHNIPADFNFDLEKKEKLCAIISSNKSAGHPKELYTERVKAIRWFEKNYPQDFDLYGQGWDRHHFNGEFLGFKLARLNRLKFLTKLLRPYYLYYKGSIKSKKETYQKYKFSICYENVKDIPGYITEKIMDCFLGGCVPIYLGAQNIADHIPKDTFIDKRSFDSYEKLYAYIKHMPNKEYQNYLDNIGAFLKSDKAHLFSAEYFVNTIIREII
ncbi:MAG: hypothetical protein HY005_01210 [Candidatus Staskawiczbacteria bacterium]|nr:hypothetical protein [Candidatus Staskawiczbacteria bacterium]MBI3337225.1 hypothetical protein [Candidatus Staskawiczbacteria bacterium]